MNYPTTITLANIDDLLRAVKKEIGEVQMPTRWLILEDNLRRFARSQGFILVRKGDEYTLRAMTKRKPKPRY